jgi:serine/threonine-protein kinase haspin
MDHLVHGVKATVIDLGLARMDTQADDGSTEVCWTPFDEEIFEGEGWIIALDSSALCSFEC